MIRFFQRVHLRRRCADHARLCLLEITVTEKQASMEPAALKKKVVEDRDQGHLFPPNAAPEGKQHRPERGLSSYWARFLATATCITSHSYAHALQKTEGMLKSWQVSA